MICKKLLLFCILMLTSRVILAQSFDYSGYNVLLKKYVTAGGVDYQGLLKDKEKLFAVTEKFAAISPESHPHYFKNDSEKFTYWINTYNVFILKTIIEYYPVKSIKDISFGDTTVWFHKHIIGGERRSFKFIEDSILSNRFRDPRFHFAINCASVSCPPLRDEAFVAEILESQLNEMASAFINNQDNFRINMNKNEIYISAIFDWYKQDFLNWLKNFKNMNQPHILDYIKIYYNGEIKPEFYKFKSIRLEYDWGLNESGKNN